MVGICFEMYKIILQICHEEIENKVIHVHKFYVSDIRKEILLEESICLPVSTDDYCEIYFDYSYLLLDDQDIIQCIRFICNVRDMETTVKELKERGWKDGY